MSSAPAERYELLIGKDFETDFRRLTAAAAKNPGGPEDHLRRNVVREMSALAAGTSDGHHPLGYESGKGDLRDCVTSYAQSDPQKKADHRLAFREMPPPGPGQLPRRELLAVKPRQGSNGIYAHVAARLNRHPNDRQPGLNAFGDRPAGSGGNQASRQAELDTKRAMAHAYPGQVPLATSRPLDPAAFGRRDSAGAAASRTAAPSREPDRGT